MIKKFFIIFSAIVYIHQGVFVCIPDEAKKENKEAIQYQRKWQKYMFDKECETKIKIEKIKVLQNAR